MKKYLLFLWEFLVGNFKSSIFPLLLILGIIVTKKFNVPYRYDVLLIYSITIQVIMYKTKMETKQEIYIICIFHLVGLAMEIFKVNMGSWTYPDYSITKVFGVPLYSGFMYASVASYICQAWKNFNLSLYKWPDKWKLCLIGVVIYLNFFLNHFVPDARYLIKIILVILFWHTIIYYEINNKYYRVPIILCFLFFGVLLWVAENIATYYGIWKYPYQSSVWKIVSLSKLSSWFLLVIISFILVAFLKVGDKKTELN